MKKAWRPIGDALQGGASKKLTKVSVSEGKTSWPKTSADQQNYGVRFDFAGQTTTLKDHPGEVFNKFQVQPNAGKIPSTFKDWRDKNGGTHAVMGTMYVKAGGNADDVEEAFQKFKDEFAEKT